MLSNTIKFQRSIVDPWTSSLIFEYPTLKVALARLGSLDHLA